MAPRSHFPTTADPARDLVLLAGTANPRLAEAVAGELGLACAKRRLERFPDGEIDLELLEPVRGRDVFVVQPTSPPADRHLLELALLVDAARRAGARRVTAVVPYFGYARQDRRARGREPLGARLVADILAVAGVERLVALDLHTEAIESAFGVPLEHLTAVPLLAQALRASADAGAVVVAPDLGAVKLAERYAALLHLPVAVVHKTRISGSEVSPRGLVGEVQGRLPIVVDDMIATGATATTALAVALGAGARGGAVVAASHGLFVGGAVARLRLAGIAQVIVTDSVATEHLAAPGDELVETVSLAPLLAGAIRRLHMEEPLEGLARHA